MTTAVASAHNGGRIQVNSGDLQTGGEFAFLNHLKTAQAWERRGSVGGPPAPDTLDENGFPHTFPTIGGAQGVYTVIYIPHSSKRPGNYVIKWTGDGSIGLGSGHALESGSMSGANGRAVVSITEAADATYTDSARIVLNLMSRGPTDYIRDLVFVHADDETRYDSGEIFGTLFKQRLSEAGAGVFRDLGWGEKNENFCTTWATRKPVSYWSYKAHELRPSLYAGVASGSGGAYTVTIPGGGSPVQGTTIHWMPNHTTESGTPTLNGIPIVWSTGDPLYPDDNTQWIVQDRLRTSIYDADLDCWITPGPRYGYGLANGIPPETFVQLCAEMGMHPWFCQPYLSADPGTDYMGGNAQMVKDFCAANGITWMVPRFEGPNETWNFYTGFHAARYGWKKAFERWGASAGTTNHNEWYGRVMSVTGQAVSAVYGGDRNRYWVVAGVQTVVTPSAQASRFESPLHVADTSAAQAAKNWVTHIAPTNYWNVSTDAYNGEATTAAAWAAAATQAAKDAIIATYVGTAADEMEMSFKSITDGWGAYTSGYGLGLTFYEGNYSPDYNYGATRNAFRAASRWDEQILYVHLRCYGICTAAGGQFPALLNFAGPSAWSVMDPSIYNEEMPAWRATKLYAQRKRRIRLS